MTDVHLYTMQSIGHFANDTHPDFNIGQMLSYWNKELGDVDLLLSDEDRPLIMKLEDRLYEFAPRFILSADPLKMIPVESSWKQLKDKETISVTPEEIRECVSILGSLSKSFSYQHAARRLLAQRLNEREKHIAIFSTDKNKLAVYICYRPKKVFVERNSSSYSELMSQLI